MYKFKNYSKPGNTIFCSHVSYPDKNGGPDLDKPNYCFETQRLVKIQYRANKYPTYFCEKHAPECVLKYSK